EGVERGLLEQGVAAGEEEAVEIAGLGEALAGLPFIDADADRADRPFLTQAQQRTVASGHYLGEALVHGRLSLMRPDVDVMDMDDIEPCQPETLQTILDRAQHAIIGIVELRREGQDAAIEPAIGRRVRSQ